MTPIHSVEELNKTLPEKFKFSNEIIQAVSKDFKYINHDHCQIQGAGGSGKTVTILFKIAQLCSAKEETPRKIFVVTYKKQQAQTICETLKKWKLKAEVYTAGLIKPIIFDKINVAVIYTKKAYDDDKNIAEKIINNIKTSHPDLAYYTDKEQKRIENLHKAYMKPFETLVEITTTQNEESNIDNLKERLKGELPFPSMNPTSDEQYQLLQSKVGLVYRKLENINKSFNSQNKAYQKILDFVEKILKENSYPDPGFIMNNIICASFISGGAHIFLDDLQHQDVAYLFNMHLKEKNPEMKQDDRYFWVICDEAQYISHSIEELRDLKTLKLKKKSLSKIVRNTKEIAEASIIIRKDISELPVIEVAPFHLIHGPKPLLILAMKSNLQWKDYVKTFQDKYGEFREKGAIAFSSMI